jgi:DNA-binding SARP family transcriptional activator
VAGDRHLEFRVLGPLEVLINHRVVPLPARKVRLLLATLLLERNRPISNDRLIETLWVGEQPRTARNALQVYVSQLRKALGRNDVLTGGPAGYGMFLEPGELDLDRFERLAGEGERLLVGGDAEGAEERLRSALALWRGPALADLAFEESVQASIHRLEELRLHALERRIDADLALGRHASLVSELETVVATQPLRERLHAQLMLALYRSARQAEALGAFQTARRVLRDELGLEPSSTLRRLEQAILIQDPALELVTTRNADVPSFPQRSLLLALEKEPRPATLELARALAGSPPRELILACPVGTEAELAEASASVNDRREALLAEGIAARAAAFVSTDPGRDLARLAVRLEVDLLLLEEHLERVADGLSGPLELLAEEAPCDLAVLFGHVTPQVGTYVLVPFGGESNDWSAVELGAWIARARGRQLRLAGSRQRRGRRDASRLLADASLAVQRALGVSVEPVLVSPGASGLLDAAEGAEVLVLGFADDWRRVGLGPTRLSLLSECPVPVLLVRDGVRPGVLAPRDSTTRYTWSLDTASPSVG